MRVARIAVLAAELAPAVWIDGPLERHVGLGAVQNRPRRHFEILHRPLALEDLALGRQAGNPHEWHSSSFAFYSPYVKRITGGAGGEIYRVAAEKIDTFITGEGPHWSAVAAEELGMNLLLSGHYATETFGVKALAGHLAQRSKIPREFLSFPTGL